MAETCDLCGKQELTPIYRPPDTTRDLTVHLCRSCGLVQSLPRTDCVGIRRPTISAGADWGNIRYGKGFRTGVALEIISETGALKQHSTVLDVGANRGSFLFAIEQQQPNLELWAVEPDAQVVDEYAGHPAIRLFQDRIENVSLPAAYFDFVYCSHTLEHVASPQRVLAQIRESLSLSGLLLAEVPNLDFVAQGNLIEEFFIDKHLYHYSPITFIAALEEAGLETLQIWIDRENVTILAKNFTPRKPRAAQLEVDRIERLISSYSERLHTNRALLRNAALKILSFGQCRVAVWGGGRIFDSLITYGDLDPKMLCGLFDRELPNYVNSIHGIPVLFPKYFEKIAPDVLVIASRVYLDEIREQAQTLCTWPMRVFSLFELMDA
jgi:SAM-dependent methyltransferase